MTAYIMYSFQKFFVSFFPNPPPPNKLLRPWVRDGFKKGAHKDGAQGHESGVGRGGCMKENVQERGRKGNNSMSSKS